MSAYHEIFLRPRDTGRDLLRDLEMQLGARPRRHTDGGEGFVVGYDGAWIDIYLEHTLEDDLGLQYSRYPYFLTVRAPGRDQADSLEIARRVARLLAEHYESFTVWNTTELVDAVS
jgi:hypothetical protein